MQAGGEQKAGECKTTAAPHVGEARKAYSGFRQCFSWRFDHTAHFVRLPDDDRRAGKERCVVREVVR